MGKPVDDVEKSHLHSRGPAFSDRQGFSLKPAWLEIEVLDHLHTIQCQKPEIIPKDVNVYEEYGFCGPLEEGLPRKPAIKGFKRTT